ncbi:serine protease AprX [Tumebacillus sp. BK434]|uniref:S8 family serine peptidase n=1 Tax=Tumebacillus sp. BK434 TaxID=2512169 RepID=UPI0010D78835|nr:S8 family serine peptidase [Tumebacillus sp. BK434]TCP52408.1 serine protease AprX [Tumebacillus sp. BK434]
MKKKAWAVLALSAALTVTSTASFAAAEKKPDSSDSKNIEKMVDSNKNKVFDDLESLLTSKASNEEINVIVRLNEKFAAHKLNKLKDEIGTFKTKHTYEHAYQGFAAALTKSQIEKLQKHPLIESIQYDAPVHKTMNTAPDSFGSRQAGIDFGLTGDRDGNETSYSSTDVVVAVIDTGIDGTHVDLDGGKILAFRDFVGPTPNPAPYDDDGHGTHVSGIIAGTGEGNSGYKGVAPGAGLVGIKVLDGNGSGTMADVDAGINWAIANKNTYGIKVINLSLGTSGSSDGNDSTSQAIDNAVANGLVAVIAAGNSGPRKSTIGSPGAAREAITVGAFADVGERGFNVTSFSSRGPTADGRVKPDIMAPGYNIMAPRANSTNQYVSYSGTSMATPFTAGVAALMFDANYALTPVDIKNKLITTAQDWGVTGQDVDYGWGRLQAYEAIKSAGGYTGTGPSVPNHQFWSGNLTAKGQSQSYTFNVTSTATPIALTLLMPNWTSSSTPDFDLYLTNPSGTQVGSSLSTSRQETITFQPTVTGTYTVRVYSYNGTGAYHLDGSFK